MDPGRAPNGIGHLMILCMSQQINSLEPLLLTCINFDSNMDK